MQYQPIVSIIVAVYNAEETLHRCLESLVNQTYKPIEIIIIDDGSTDKSAAICGEYATKDSRIKVVSQENHGVAYTRQRGIDIATGTYVIHADPDDWVERDSLELMVEYAEKQGADMTICDFWHNYDDKEILISQKPTELNHLSVILDFFPRLHGSCCNKLVRRSTILKYGIRFNEELSFSEDLVFNISLLSHPITVSYLDVAHYHYEYKKNGTSLAYRYNAEVATNDQKLFEVMKNTIPIEIQKQTLPQVAGLLLNRAYEGHVHTSDEFKRLFKPYFKYINEIKLPIEKRILLLLSKHGFYRFSYCMSHTWVKKIYYGFFNLLRKLNQKIR